MGCHALLQGINLGIEPTSPEVPELQVDSFTAESPGKAIPREIYKKSDFYARLKSR